MMSVSFSEMDLCHSSYCIIRTWPQPFHDPPPPPPFSACQAYQRRRRDQAPAYPCSTQSRTYSWTKRKRSTWAVSIWSTWCAVESSCSSSTWTTRLYTPRMRTWARTFPTFTTTSSPTRTSGIIPSFGRAVRPSSSRCRAYTSCMWSHSARGTTRTQSPGSWIRTTSTFTIEFCHGMRSLIRARRPII